MLWHMPIILAIQEAEVGRLKQVWGQPGIHNTKESKEKFLKKESKENNLIIHAFVQQLSNIFWVKNGSRNLECVSWIEQI